MLGLYLGTIAYTLAVLSNVQSETFEVDVPRFSIVMNILLGMMCFGAFIYFIHEISSVIQVGNIIKRLYNDTRKSLIRELSSGNYNTLPVPYGDWHKVHAWQSGYFFKVGEASFRKEAQKCKLKVRVLKLQGGYLLKGEEFLAVNQPVDEQLMHVLMGNFIFEKKELIASNYFYGFKQITEIALKALSPGINDPGTALQAIHFLTDLFICSCAWRGKKCCAIKMERHSSFILPCLLKIPFTWLPGAYEILPCRTSPCFPNWFA